MVDAHKYSHTAHHTGPLPLELVWFTQTAVNTRVEEPDHCCRRERERERERVSTEHRREKQAHRFTEVTRSTCLLFCIDVKVTGFTDTKGFLSGPLMHTLKKSSVFHLF